MKLKQPQQEEDTKKQKTLLILQTNCSSEDREWAPRGYAAEMLETTYRKKSVEPPKVISSAKIRVRLGILILFVMLILLRDLQNGGPC